MSSKKKVVPKSANEQKKSEFDPIMDAKNEVKKMREQLRSNPEPSFEYEEEVEVIDDFDPDYSEILLSASDAEGYEADYKVDLSSANALYAEICMDNSMYYAMPILNMSYTSTQHQFQDMREAVASHLDKQYPGVFFSWINPITEYLPLLPGVGHYLISIHDYMLHRCRGINDLPLLNQGRMSTKSVLFYVDNEVFLSSIVLANANQLSRAIEATVARIQEDHPAGTQIGVMMVDVSWDSYKALDPMS